jgi:hypothetical protein
LSQAAAAPHVDLPEAIPGRIESLYEKRIVVGVGVNVGHAPLVDDDLGLLLEAGHRIRMILCRGIDANE